jgi:hypothetical protein
VRVRSLRALGRRSSRGPRRGGEGLMCRVSGRGRGGQGVSRQPARGVLDKLGRQAFVLRPSAYMQALREFYPTNGFSIAPATFLG